MEPDFCYSPSELIWYVFIRLASSVISASRSSWRSVCLGFAVFSLFQRGPFHNHLNSEQFPNNDFFPTPWSCSVWECGCLFHFKLVEPRSYQAADISKSPAVNKMARAQFFLSLPVPFTAINGNWYVQSYSHSEKNLCWVLPLQDGESSAVSRLSRSRERVYRDVTVNSYSSKVLN